MDFTCKTTPTFINMALLQHAFTQPLVEFTPWMFSSTIGWNYHHGNFYSHDAELSEFITRNKGIALSPSGHSWSAWKVVHDLFIRFSGGRCRISMLLWILFVSSFAFHSCFEKWKIFFKQNVIESWLKTIIQNVNCYVLNVQCNNALLSWEIAANWLHNPAVDYCKCSN